MANIVLRTPRTHDGMIVDIGIISGFMASSYLIMRAAPHIRPTGAALIRHCGPFWDQLKQKALLAPDAVSALASFIRSRQKSRKCFVRWLGSNLPSILFGPAPRICVLMQGVAYNSADEILRNRQIRPALSELEEFNDEGIIVAYAKTSDTESEVLEPTDSVADLGFGDTWTNPNFSIKFDPWAGGGCSTPMGYASPVQNWLATSVNPPFPIEDSVAQEANAVKIATLEAELAKMKAMCEMILQNQASSHIRPEEAVVATSKSIPKPPVAPPPPPPPPPALGQSAQNQKVIKLKTKSELESVQASILPDSKVVPLSLADVLKGLGAVKLKPVERSPGGTPFKPKKSLNEMDPASMIAAALKKRFASMQSPSPVKTSQEDDDDLSDKENQRFDASDDSFTRSPSFFQFGTSSSQQHKCTNGTDSSCVLKRTSLDNKFNTSVSRKRKSKGGSPAESGQLPLFGQHLLKRRISSSLLKKQARLSLHEENNESS